MSEITDSDFIHGRAETIERQLAILKELEELNNMEPHLLRPLIDQRQAALNELNLLFLHEKMKS